MPEGALSPTSPPILGRRWQWQDAQPAHHGLCCTGFRASITQRPRTSAQKPRQTMKWRAGAGQTRAPILKYGRGAPVSAQACGRHALPFAQAPGWRGVLSLRRRPALRAFPLSQRRAGTQRAIGKARSAAEVRGAASGRKRPGADFRRERGSPEPQAWSLPTLPSLPFPFTSFPCSNGLAGRIGYTGRRRGSRWEDEDPPSSLLCRNGAAESVPPACGSPSFPSSLPFTVPLSTEMVV